jgi:SulP family sulfate permease
LKQRRPKTRYSVGKLDQRIVVPLKRLLPQRMFERLFGLAMGLSIILSLLHGVWTTTRTNLVEMERIPGTTVWWPASATPTGERVPGLLVVAFQVPLSFLNAALFRRDLSADRPDRHIRLVVLEARSIIEIDYSAALALRQAIETCRNRGIDFVVARLESRRAQDVFERFGVIGALGARRLA